MLKVAYKSIPTLVQIIYEYRMCPFYPKTREHYGRWKITFETNGRRIPRRVHRADIYFISQRL